MKYAEKHKTPRQEGGACRGVGMGQGLVEADAGYVGSLDGSGVVEFIFGEGEGEVLDAVVEPSSRRNTMSLPSSSVSQSVSLVEVTATSSITLSGRL